MNMQNQTQLIPMVPMVPRQDRHPAASASDRQSQSEIAGEVHTGISARYPSRYERT